MKIIILLHPKLQFKYLDFYMKKIYYKYNLQLFLLKFHKKNYHSKAKHLFFLAFAKHQESNYQKVEME